MQINLAELCAAFHAEFCAVRKLCAAVGAKADLAAASAGFLLPRWGRRPCSRRWSRRRSTSSRPRRLGSGLLAATAGAEGHIVAVGGAAGAFPAALLSLLLLGLLLLSLLILHLLLVGGGERARHVARGIHAKANAP